MALRSPILYGKFARGYYSHVNWWFHVVYTTTRKKWLTLGWSIPLLYGWPPSYCSAACSSRPSSTCTWGFLSHGYPKKKCLFQCKVMVSWLWMNCGYYTFLDTSIFVHLSMLHMNMSPQQFHFASVRPLKKWLDQVCDFWVTLQSHQIYGGFSWKINYINGWCWITMFDYQRLYSSSQVSLSGSYSIMYQGCCEHPKYKLANPPPFGSHLLVTGWSNPGKYGWTQATITLW